MNRARLAAILLFAALVGTMLAYLLLTRWYLVAVDVQTVGFVATEAPTIGFSLNKDHVSFGKIPIGGGADRKASVSSRVPTIARIEFTGTAAPYVWADPSCLTLNGREPHPFALHVDVPNSTPEGNYSGTIRITYTRQLPWNVCV